MGQENIIRPTFLITICILTFIGSGVEVLDGLLGIIGIPSLLGTNHPPASISIQIIGTIASGLCFFGALLMWNLKKIGFILYVIGAIISTIISILIVNLYTQVNEMPFSNTTLVIIVIITNIAFISMYYANRNHLKN
ncbi:MAG: hypothetical protein ACK49D_03720 [Flavobacteriia bacterium]|jgi:hypothetical protein|nr:hypothetical protein [Cryomorphaceae bacterium]